MPRPPIILLAGGNAFRLGGGDKGLRLLGGTSLISHIIRRLGAEGSAFVLNANGDPARFASLGLPIIADEQATRDGPLAGILAGMVWAAAQDPAIPHIVTVPTDIPFVPTDLVDGLLEAQTNSGAEIACASSGGRRHPVVALWPVRLATALRAALHNEGLRKVERWLGRYRIAEADFADRPVDPFFNVNRPEDLATAEHLLRQLGSSGRSPPEN
jgi:molybdopterin-guanine dinucleotide biosynthesis protein A